jgi:hypothetical protein
MGDGIYGAEAATQHWYKKNCKSLTRMQAAGIAAILPKITGPLLQLYYMLLNMMILKISPTFLVTKWM